MSHLQQSFLRQCLPLGQPTTLARRLRLLVDLVDLQSAHLWPHLLLPRWRASTPAPAVHTSLRHPVLLSLCELTELIGWACEQDAEAPDVCCMGEVGRTPLDVANQQKDETFMKLLEKTPAQIRVERRFIPIPPEPEQPQPTPPPAIMSKTQAKKEEQNSGQLKATRTIRPHTKAGTPNQYQSPAEIREQNYGVQIRPA